MRKIIAACGIFLYLCCSLNAQEKIIYIYHIETGLFEEQSDGDSLSIFCYSGAPGYVNDTTATKLKDKGPIPIGTYSITDYSSSKGPLTIVLLPLPGNTMFGRSDFRIHGDNSEMNQSASNGCIIMSKQYRQLIVDRIIKGYDQIVIVQKY